MVQLFSIVCFSQQKDSLVIYKEVDDMTGEIYYYTSRDLTIIDPSSKRAFVLFPFIDNDLIVRGLSCKRSKIGAECSDKDELIIMFTDSSKLSFTSKSKYNCDGKSLFLIEYVNNEREHLSSMKIKKIRFANGKDYTELTREMPKKDEDYFIQLFYAIDNNKIKLSPPKKK